MPPPWFSSSNRLCRAAFSLACASLASVVVCAAVLACNYEKFFRSLTSWSLFVRGAVLLILLAWVMTLPLVLLISRFDGWRFWFLAASGTLVGPALLIVTTLCIEFAEHQTLDIVEGWKTGFLIMGSTVTGISLIATALYLGTLRYCARRQVL
jgi:hypothetical protein